MRAILLALSAATIRVTLARAPAPEIDVFFSTPHGELIAHARTDARGEASRPVPAGGSITVATYDRDLDSFELMTVLDVEPTDRIHVELETYAVPRKVVDVLVTLPPLAGASHYRVRSSCGEIDAEPGEAAKLPITNVCLPEGTFDVSARALSASDELIGYTYLAAVVPDPSGGSMSLALPPWRTDLIPVTISVLDPPSRGRVRVSADPIVGDTNARGGAGGAPFPRTVFVQAALAERLEVTLTVDVEEERTARVISRLEHRAPFIGADAAALLPRVIDVGWDAADEKRPSVLYRFDAPPVGADGAWIGVSWYRRQRLNWTILGPPSPGPIKLPGVPAALAAGFQPGGEPSFAIATLFDRSAVHRWAQIRIDPTETMTNVIVREPGEIQLRYSQGRAQAR